MLPVCSAAATCSSSAPPYSQLSLHLGTRAFHPLWKGSDCGVQDGVHAQESAVTFTTRAAKCAHSLVVEKPDQSGWLDSSIFSPYPNDFDDIARGFPGEAVDGGQANRCYSGMEMFGGLHPVSEEFPQPEMLPDGVGNSIAGVVSSSYATEGLASPYVELPSTDSINVDLSQSVGQSIVALPNAASVESVSASDGIAVAPLTVSDTVEATSRTFLDFGENIEKTIGRAEASVESSYNAFKFSVSEAIKSLTESLDSSVNGLLSTTASSKQQAANELTGFSDALKENVYAAGSLTTDLLRQGIIYLENSLGKATSFFVYSYGSAKSFLPPNIRETLNLSEERAIEIISPVGSALHQVYVIIEGLEKNIGLDPTDPLLQFVLLLGSSTVIGVSYWSLIYGGYSGDLSPEMTLELLKNDKKAVLIDVRPEDLREKDGIPDLRREARSKYANVIDIEIDGSVRKLLKGGRDVNDALIAAVIRNLKIVRDQTKVIIMDSSDGRSKAIARSLKKLGMKNSYLVQGGFQSWVKRGLRIKDVKPETALTILNEEAEAIIEEIKLTPALVIGYGLGISAAIYAFLEWETTLQIIGVFGLALTLYLRVASYEDSKDLQEDLRLLLSPVQLGSQAFSWAATKLEPNKIGLPTSPSSTAVRDRVVQAAAKHESQPSDSEESLAQTNESLDLSEA